MNNKNREFIWVNSRSTDNQVKKRKDRKECVWKGALTRFGLFKNVIIGSIVRIGHQRHVLIECVLKQKWSERERQYSRELFILWKVMLMESGPAEPSLLERTGVPIETIHCPCLNCMWHGSMSGQRWPTFVNRSIAAEDHFYFCLRMLNLVFARLTLVFLFNGHSRRDTRFIGII